ncbi:MAG TPA: VOC family protein [Pseudolabrys sp.]|nr:VOC family protein [Pseudolabrys sp.]
MPAGLDHTVHAVHDLEAAAHFYRRLGFTVGARNRHPWGTHNHVVQVPGFFVELLTVAEPDKLGTDGFSRMFGAFNRDFLAHGEGLSLLILESVDAAADAAAFQKSGITASGNALRFERAGTRPDGSEVTVAFSLAFARDPRASRAGFAVCQQHFPENFWNPQFQQHANSAGAVAGVVLVAADPTLHRDFVAAFTGRPEVDVMAGGLIAQTARGEIAVLTPDAFRAAYDTPPPEGDGIRLAALRFRVADIASAEDALAAGEIEADIGSDRIVVAPDVAMGATIVFEDGGER